MALVEHVAIFAQNLIDPHSPHGIGLPGACLLMALGSTIAPVPNEAVMPVVGSLVHNGTFGWTQAIIWTTVGSLLGSIFSYYLGYFGGKPLVMKIGRFLLVNEHHLDLTTRWFHKHGGATVFISRFVPIIRHLISIPAGIGRMPMLSFIAYTVIGATLYNIFLLWIGYWLKDQWSVVLQYSHPIDLAFIALCVIGAIAWLALHLKKPQIREKGS